MAGSASLRLRLLVAGLLLLSPSALRANPSLLVDVDTGAVLHSDEATTPWHPASTAKLMTVYLALKAIQQGKLSLETPLAGTRRASAQRPSKIGIRPGQIITLDNALKILLVKSANDLAYVIGEAIGGSADNFVGMMNQEAARLGMHESVFSNPNGWHDARQQVSARDLATLALALLRDFPEYRDYWGIGSVQLGNRVYKNTNGLIGRYPGAMGMKTGFVCASGFNVVGLASRNGRTLLAVILGASGGMERTVMAAQLFDRGFASGSQGPSLASLPASGVTTASDMRSQICGRARRAPLNEEDFDGAFSAATIYSGGSDKDSIYATIHERQARASSGGAPAGGRYPFEERSLGVPVAVYLGRAPGNTEAVYNAFGTTAMAERPAIGSQAFAPVQAGMKVGMSVGAFRLARPAARVPRQAAQVGGIAGEEPMALEPSGPVRPGAAAGIRPRVAMPATRPSLPAASRSAALVRPAPVYAAASRRGAAPGKTLGNAGTAAAAIRIDASKAPAARKAIASPASTKTGAPKTGATKTGATKTDATKAGATE